MLKIEGVPLIGRPRAMRKLIHTKQMFQDELVGGKHCQNMLRGRMLAR